MQKLKLSGAFIAGLFIILFQSPGYGFASTAEVKRTSEIESRLNEFLIDPLVFMEQPPAKFDAEGQPLKSESSLFSLNEIKSREFVKIKSARIKSEPTPNDRVEEFVDRFALNTLEKIQAANLTQARLEVAPWSDTYWPLYAGGLALRYADPHFPESENWKENADYITSTQNSCSVDQLSPAEKYELVIGDMNHTLSRRMLSEGRQYFERYGKVERWMGLCHGWAPASFMLPRPTSLVNVMAYDGKTEVPFYPSDMKGLATTLWANGVSQDRSIGTRCNIKDPKKNSKGRVIDPGCFDTNPATWHLSVVNQIGVSKRSFILDATYDAEVWNQPVVGYRYTLFNPQTGKAARTIEAASVRREDFTADKFKEFRSARADTFVGIAMDVVYVKETSPSHAVKDSVQADYQVTVRYFYDLEIDANGAIIGGEWYENIHPDFLWVPHRGAKVLTLGDEALNRAGSRTRWNGSRPVPAEWRSAGIEGSREGQPLGRIVNTLIHLSRIGI